MKTVLLMRHAKAIEGDGQMPDRERPLAARGLDDAPKMGKAIQERGIVPDTILSSAAMRTRQTTEAVVQAAGFAAEPQFLASLYGASYEKVAEILRGLPDEYESVLVVGHNPTTTELVMGLSGIGNAEMPTAAVACITFAIAQWEDIEDDGGKLEWLLTPKQLPGNS